MEKKHMNEQEKGHLIALSKVTGVGALTMKMLLAHCGSAMAVFSKSKEELMAIPSISQKIAKSIVCANATALYEDELKFITLNDIRVITYLEDDFPVRFKPLIDSPALLYYKGTMDLNKARMLAVIGTRNPSPHAVALTEQIVAGLKSYNVGIISGLAYGIDIAAHRSALKNNMETLCVVAHGLDRVYPSMHEKAFNEMIQHGGALTEFPSGVVPNRERFPMRNRIVAGLCDVVLVVESGKSGGSMITVQYANDYNRDVLAIPGRVGDALAEGTNYLIKSNMAALVESADDIVQMMLWDKKKITGTQTSLFPELDEREKHILHSMELNEIISIEHLIVQSDQTPSQLSAILLSLEFKGVLKALPGNRYMRI